MTPEHTALVAWQEMMARTKPEHSAYKDTAAALRELAGEIADLKFDRIAANNEIDFLRSERETLWRERDALRAGRDQLMGTVKNLQDLYFEQRTEADTLRAEVAALKPDAERWVKAKTNWPWMVALVDALDAATEQK